MINTKLNYENEEYDLDDLGVRYNTITFYTGTCYECGGDDDDCKVCDEHGLVETESEFGRCDLTNWRGSVVSCIGLNSAGELVEFQVLDTFVHGRLGKLAGAF